ncbi:TPR repeat region-containing protein [Nocardia macrotermitis]|uniref:TPR repeat domain-containing protein n=1 Tax=Nocardia macrotermitis TaxID=2585198 RepID=A0A7K0CWU6_9NOCA|nr:hypothetical protein [Nocardia macrotermitis]MQY17422.1 hypothetical protein [Nocardia macrotermitis]
MALLSQVKAWNTGRLNDLATTVTTANESMKEQLDKTKKHFSDVHADWSGKAYDAAYNRVGQDYNQGTKLAGEVGELPTVLRQAASSLDSHRTVLLGKVNDAIAAGLTVSDRWEVSGTNADKVHAHQDLINTAYHALNAAATDAAKKITDQAEFIRAAGDLLGSSFDVSDDRTAAAGARLADEDAKALADALRRNDSKAIDEILSRMPQGVLSAQDIEDMNNGKNVTVPAEVQNYYKEFYKDLGADNLLSLNDHLNSESKTSPAAVAQQNAIADSIKMLSSEKVGTGIDKTGKLISPGDYTRLPSDVRKLVSSRLEDADWGKIAPQGPNVFKKHLTDEIKFADLISHGDQSLQPGTTFGTELGRQGASLAAYMDGKDPQINQWINQNWKPITPDGFFDQPDHHTLDSAAEKYLGVAGTNHESAYQLLTGLNSHTGKPLPADLSFGAIGDDYKHDGNYDPSKFGSEVFQHTWDDKGKSAASLVDWIGEHTHDKDHLGDMSREAYAKLPDILAPHDKDGNMLTQGGKSIFQLTADSFLANPELATGLSKTLAPNLDSMAGLALTTGVDGTNAHLSGPDVDHLLFLGAQSDTGKLYLETSRQLYDQAVVNQIISGHDPDSVRTPETLANLDSRVNAAILNAGSYQHVHHAMDGLAHQQDTHDVKQEASKIAKEVFKGATKELVNKFPGGEIVHGIVGNIRDDGWDSSIEQWNPKPDSTIVAFPRAHDVGDAAVVDFDSRLQAADSAAGLGRWPDGYKDYRVPYDSTYKQDLSDGLITSKEKLENFLSGGSKIEPSTK